MKITARRMNLEYYAVQALYWAGYCVCGGYAAVFLQSMGYSNAQLGLIMALGSVTGFLLSSVLASFVDRVGRRGLFLCVVLLLLGQLALIVSFMGCSGPSPFLSVGYSLYMAFVVCVNPMNTQLCFTLQEQYGHINYGAARAMGSLAFAPTSIMMGRFVESSGSTVLLKAGILLVLLQGALLAAVYVQTMGKGADIPRARKEESASLPVFMRENGSFCLLLVGVMLMFFSHNLINSFLINLVRHAGGDESQMGSLSAFMAFLELPAMIFYDRLSRRAKCVSLLKFSAFMYIVKTLSFALSGSMGALYAAGLTHGLSFALITPALVHFVNLYIPQKDAAKGQALATGAMTMGNVFACSIGGLLFDALSVPAVLFIGTAVAAAGAGVCFLACRRTKSLA